MISRRQFTKLLAAGTIVPAASTLGQARSRPALTLPLQIDETEIDLAGTIAKTWAYNGQVPGPEIRLKAGELLRVPVKNLMPDPTLIHWHGISLENSMDGTRLTQAAISPNAEFNYEFIVPEAGTHWYHSHSGEQADFGLYAPFIVEERNEDLSYDREYVLVLDDWNHGLPPPKPKPPTSPTPKRVNAYSRFSFNDFDLNDLEPIISFGGRSYRYILVNGKPAQDPAVFDVRKGDRVRLRIINAAADTAFRFAISGHELTVTHSDGMPVEPVRVDALRIGMAERYDVLIEANSPQIAQIGLLPEGKKGFGRALLKYREANRSSVPLESFRPEELEKKLLDYNDLLYKLKPKVPKNSPIDKQFEMTLFETDIEVNGMGKEDPIIVKKGDVVKFSFKNNSKKWHPIHMHGHHFHLLTSGYALKDTAVVSADGGELSWVWKADNPGAWLMHCHNLYHNKDGMMRVIVYEEALDEFYNLPEGMTYKDLCV